MTLVTGCSSMVLEPLLKPITLSLQQQNDITLLKDGAPSLLLMIDGLIAANPDNSDLLLDGTRAYASYASALEEFGEDGRAKTVSEKAKNYGIQLLRRISAINTSFKMPVSEFGKYLNSVDNDDIDKLFWGAYGWATWIGLQNGSPAAIADLPRVEKIMLRVVELDDNYYYGAPHLFLGYFYGALPKMYGGKPEQSRVHFEKALAISKRNFLGVQVAYAQTYARLNFDRALFESLLKEVLDRPADAIPELTAGNQMAKMHAKRLLENIDNYF